VPRLGPAKRADVVATLVILASVAALAIAGPLRRRLSAHPSAEDCADLVERWAEHSAKELDPDALASTIAAARTQARARAWTIARCTAELTQAEARCAKSAHTADEFERCMH